ncbi:MAG: hypothetical protein ACRDKW_06935 [Actinomycetota bacterium]
MSFKFPGGDRFTSGRKKQDRPALPDDMRAVMERANKAYARLSKGRSLPPLPTGGPLSDADRKSVARVMEEITGRKPKGRVNDPEVNQRLGRLFGGGAPSPVRQDGPERPPDRSSTYREGPGRIPPRY